MPVELLCSRRAVKTWGWVGKREGRGSEAGPNLSRDWLPLPQAAYCELVVAALPPTYAFILQILHTRLFERLPRRALSLYSFKRKREQSTGALLHSGVPRETAETFGRRGRDFDRRESLQVTKTREIEEVLNETLRRTTRTVVLEASESRQAYVPILTVFFGEMAASFHPVTSISHE